jgi:hypothetical protein
MAKNFTVVCMSVLLVFSGVSALAGQSDMDKQRSQSNESSSMKGTKGKGSSIESKSSSSTKGTKDKESQEQKEARPGEAGGQEDPETSMFGSPATLPPNENSPGYTGADKDPIYRGN